jgi:hypothetical protein
MCECLEINDVCFLVNMFFLAKPKCPVLTDKTYASLDLIVVNLLSSISRNTCTHTYVAPLGCIDIGGALLHFLEKYAK